MAWVLVSGSGDARAGEERAAEEVGRLLAEAGAVVLSGGRGGVMEASCRGARQAGGLTVGVLDAGERAAANAHVAVPIATGMGEMRNALLVRNADAVIAIGGGPGTLSEIALALRAGRPVVGVDTWAIDGVVAVDGPAAAVRAALDAVR